MVKKGRVGPQANKLASKLHFFLFFRVGGPQAHKQKIVDNGPGMGYSTSITDGNARLAQLNASPSIPLGSMPVSPSQVPCNSLKKVWGKAVASPGVGILKKNKKIKKTASSQAYKLFIGWVGPKVTSK